MLNKADQLQVNYDYQVERGEKLEAKNVELRKHACHLLSCDRLQKDAGSPCTCGLDDLLKGDSDGS